MNFVVRIDFIDALLDVPYDLINDWTLMGDYFTNVLLIVSEVFLKTFNDISVIVVFTVEFIRKKSYMTRWV